MGFILVEQTQTSVEHTKFSLLYFVDHNQTMLVEHNHTMPVEHTNGDAEYLRNCNAGIFPKWICRNISEVMLHVGISPKYQCRNISEIIQYVGISPK